MSVGHVCGRLRRGRSTSERHVFTKTHNISVAPCMHACIVVHRTHQAQNRSKVHTSRFVRHSTQRLRLDVEYDIPNDMESLEIISRTSRPRPSSVPAPSSPHTTIRCTPRQNVEDSEVIQEGFCGVLDHCPSTGGHAIGRIDRSTHECWL